MLLCRVQHYFCVALFLQRRGLTPQLHRIVSSGLLQTSQSIGHASLVNLKINQKSMWIQSKVQKPKLSIMNKSINIAFFLVLCCVSVGKFMCLKIITFAFPPKLTTLLLQASQFFTNWTKLEGGGGKIVANFIIQLFLGSCSQF